MRTTVLALVVIIVGIAGFAQCEQVQRSLPTAAPPLVADKASAIAADVAAPKPKPVVAAKPRVIKVDPVAIADLEGPATVVPGKAFIVFYTVNDPKDGCRVTWDNTYPDGAVPPFRATSEDGRSMFVFIDSTAGEYRLSVEVQYPAVGLDPFARDTLVIKVGTPLPPIPTVVPSLETQAAMLPVKSIMAVADKAKARIWAGAWTDFLTKLSANPPLTIGSFDAAVNAYGNQVGTSAGLILAFPGLSDATDAAFTKLLGKQDGPLDKAKATDFIIGLIWSCGL